METDSKWPASLPVLDQVHLRVLGSLMEKNRTTPDYYPMTINALTAACNQKTSRKPVVQYDDTLVAETLNSLRKYRLVSTDVGGSSRSVKYKHNFSIVYPVVPKEEAIMCLLILRGAQTPGELNTNSNRLYEFESLEEVQGVLDHLANLVVPFVQQIPRRAGQKELRYVHLLGGLPDLTEDENEGPLVVSGSALEERVIKLEEEVAELKTNLEKLMKELNG